ncbi:monovalent cation/H+ antiporter subunit A [Paracoccus sp. SCSIO 75233]|uniref:monovalent cation/H+ antiporter subunit A n=1 Tax=Paracoccus sp. SCSIO 75233 TaxID=3017782 RepID=UPI0022F02E3C|nr:monovalent cation/H+ antiporter subunit A [Paracoccus sp. SCSIO 75233]WBU52732.1 monovalent cation/H+ antiporter subunit A [Paracoccus sp. SCSIO 75233]
MSPALIAVLPFLGALLPGLLIRSGRNVAASACGTMTFLALVGLCLHIPTVLAGGVVTDSFDWLPRIGLNASFRIDGLSLLFGILILGIGLLIITYARYYLSKDDPVGQFYTYLMLFQGAMVGIVLSDNILLLLVFWELTSLSSFLLIGYWKHLPEGRQGARMALTVTGMGGLAMIAGMMILGNIAGSYRITDILAARDVIQASPMYLPALVLILIGAFTKSAQFPFHFWLPHAMAAPTPVSAYLHSATMVKAGLFLMARLWPVLAGTPEWFYIVATTGLVTMLIGAVIAFFKDDLKALLAFSTVSHLGLITMLLGMGTEAAAIAAVFHIINHATFKAALFMTAGIIDHETGTRSIARLGGLRKLMPVTFLIGTIAALSMAGIPPFNGFLSKEMMLSEAADTVWAGSQNGFLIVAGVASLFSVAYSLRFIWHVFFGPERDDYPHHPHDPGFGLLVGPAFLTVLVVLIGLIPMTMVGWLVRISADAVTGLETHPKIYMWHGVNPALITTIIAVIGGIILLSAHRVLQAGWDAAPRPEAKTMFDAVIRRAARWSQAVNDALHDGRLARGGSMMAITVVMAGVFAWATGSVGPMTRDMLPIEPIPAVGFVLLIVATGCMVTFHRNRLLALVLIGIVGLIVSCAFVYLSAPDLALTQISVEVATVMLMLLALNFLPKRTWVETGGLRRGADALIATAVGLAFGGLSYAILRRDFAFETISRYHLENSHDLGGGDNVVNVTLVDFRGYDTFGEITVLGIAALVIYAMTETLMTGSSNRRLLNWKHTQRKAGDRHPLPLVIATRLILPMSLTVGLFIFLRGHNQPGGGFVAGLIVAISLLMQYMASGFAWAQERQRVPFHAMIGAGVVVAAATGMGAWLFGVPFLTSNYTYVKLPFLEEFELATAMAFDLGVFLCVLGAVMLALNSLSRIARRAGETVNREPMDVDPSRHSHQEGEAV